jgi:hypothetical protein
VHQQTPTVVLINKAEGYLYTSTCVTLAKRKLSNSRIHVSNRKNKEQSKNCSSSQPGFGEFFISSTAVEQVITLPAIDAVITTNATLSRRINNSHLDGDVQPIAEYKGAANYDPNDKKYRESKNGQNRIS